MLDEFYDLGNGVSVLHEVLEAYIGGKESPGAGMSTFGNIDAAYKSAHDKARLIDPRYVEPNFSIDEGEGKVYINKFPYDDRIKAINPQKQIVPFVY